MSGEQPQPSPVQGQRRQVRLNIAVKRSYLLSLELTNEFHDIRDICRHQRNSLYNWPYYAV